MVQGLRIPSYVRLYGVGSGSVIKLHPTAAGTSCVLTNSDYTNGNEFILIEYLDLDWNLDKNDNTISNGTNANCVGIVNSKFVRVNNVNARNPGVHGFDVSSLFGILPLMELNITNPTVANMCGLKIVLQLIMGTMASQLTILIISSSLTVTPMTLMDLHTAKELQIQTVLKLMMVLKRMACELLQPKKL